MADDSPRREKDEAEEAPKKRGSLLENKLVLLGVIVVVQALLAFAVTQFMVMPKLRNLGSPEAVAAKAEKAKSDDIDRGVIVGLNEMVVSLRDRGPVTSYLRINVDLEVRDDKVATLVGQRLPHLRDIVILSLSNKFSADLQSMDGKSALKAELFRKLGDVLPADGLLNIYFSDMVIQ